MHKHTRSVAIFWDYENCPVPSGASGWDVVKEIRRVTQVYGSIKVFKAYLELPEHSSSQRTLQLRSELQASGVSLTDCPHNGRKDVADKMMLVDMMAHAIDNPAPWTFLLISGDRDFAYAISVLRLRRYQIVLFSPPTAHISLKSQATTCLDWSNVLQRLKSRQMSGQKQGPTSVPQSVLPTTPIGAATNLQGPSKERDPYFSDDSDYTSRHSEVDVIEYLRARRRHHRLSISSDGSYSTSSESLYDTTTVYSSAKEESIRSPRLLPTSESGSNVDLNTPSKFTNRQQIRPKLNAPPSVTPTLGSVNKVPPMAPAPPTRGHIPSIYSPPGATVASPIQPPPPSLPLPRLPVPENFQLLVSSLREYRSQGFGRPARSDVARTLDKHAYIYLQSKVDKFAEYITLAERDKIVTQGGDWVALRPEWF